MAEITIKPHLSPEGCRAARAWVGYNQHDLAMETNLSVNTIRNFETGYTTLHPNNMDSVVRFFSFLGIQFTWIDDKPAGFIVSTEK